MIIKCPQCETAFNIPDEKISARGIQAKCYKCSHIFRVHKPAATPPQPVPSSKPKPPSEPSFPAPVQMRSEEAPPPSAEAAPSPSDPPGSDRFSVDLPVEEETFDEGEDLFSEEAETLAADQLTPEMKAKIERLRREKGISPPESPSLRQIRVSSGKIEAAGRATPPRPSSKVPRRLRRKREKAASITPVRTPLDWFVLLLLTALFSGGTIFGVEAARARHGSFEIRDLSYDIVQNRTAGELVIVRGVAVNGWPQPVSEIRVRGELLDQEKRPVATQSAYCGNLFTPKELESLDIEQIRSLADRQGGEAGVNESVPPSFGVYCMVVFQKPERSFSKYRMQVISGPAGL